MEERRAVENMREAPTWISTRRDAWTAWPLEATVRQEQQQGHTLVTPQKLGTSTVNEPQTPGSVLPEGHPCEHSAVAKQVSQTRSLTD
jgi:hypothetical protein